MTAFLDVFADFAAAVTVRCPHLSDEARLLHAAGLLAEVTAAVEGGTPAAVLPCGRVVRLGVEDLTVPAGTGAR